MKLSTLIWMIALAVCLFFGYKQQYDREYRLYLGEKARSQDRDRVKGVVVRMPRAPRRPNVARP